MYSYWIEKHDYSMAAEAKDVSLRDALEAFESYDWDSELTAFDRNDPHGNCPPGIGYHDGYDGKTPGTMLLHICPRDGQTVFFNLIHSVKIEKRLLGLLNNVEQEEHCVADFPRQRVPELVRWFLTGRTDWILDIPGTG